MHTFKKRLSVVLVTVALFGPIRPAMAGEDGIIAAAATFAASLLADVVAWAQVAATEAGAALQAAATEASAASIISAEYEYFNEQTAAITGAINAAMKVEAVATTDALNAHKDTMLMGMAASDKLRIAGEQSLTTLPNANQTGAAAMVAGKGITGASRVASFANIALAKRHLIPKSPFFNTADSYKNYQKNYAEGGEMPNADILVDSLLAGAQKSGNFETLTFSPAQLKAAQDFIANAVDVAPPQDIPDELANTIPGRQFRMMVRAEKARMSLSFKAFGDALAARTPIPGFNNGKEMGIPIDGDISYAEFMANEVRRRYNNQEWYGQIGGATPANLQREGLFMQALELHLRMEENRRLEKIELLLAQMNINQVAGGPLRAQIEQQRTRVIGK